MLNVGLISKWHVHAPGYARQLGEDDRVKITAVWDEVPQRGAEWAQELGVPFYADYAEFLQNCGDAVICTSQTTAHKQLLCDAAAAGKHIFTEKLLAPTVEDAQAIIAAIRGAGVTFTISLPVKNDPAARYMKQLMQDGKLGRVTAARFRRAHQGVSGGWLPAYWFDINASGGGALMDLGAHPVYMIADFFGLPKRVTALMTNLYGTSSDENTMVIAEFADGVLASMETGFVSAGAPDLFELFGTEGSVLMRGGEVVQNIGNGMEAVAREAMPEDKSGALSQFIDACLNHAAEPDGLGLEDALLMTQIAQAAYQAAQSGKTVSL